jgi:hypothetical protein
MADKLEALVIPNLQYREIPTYARIDNRTFVKYSRPYFDLLTKHGDNRPTPRVAN